MNKEEAIRVLELGATVRHDSFPKKYSIKQNGDNYEWETGEPITVEAFWKNRQTENFNKDWIVV
jgi:hypothetical protein